MKEWFILNHMHLGIFVGLALGFLTYLKFDQRYPIFYNLAAVISITILVLSITISMSEIV